MRKNEIVRAKRNQVAIVRRGRRIMHAIVSEIAWQVNELDRRTDLTHSFWLIPSLTMMMQMTSVTMKVIFTSDLSKLALYCFSFGESAL